MNDKTYKITLADGTVIENLELNGNNFISDEEITAEMFSGNLSPVTISNGESEEVHDNMALAQISHIDGKSAFILQDVSESELKAMKIQSDIEYLAMMTSVEL